MHFKSIKNEISDSFRYFFFLPFVISIIVVGTILFFYFDYTEKQQHLKILDAVETKFYHDTIELSNLLIEWVDYDSPVLYFNNKYPDFVNTEFSISVKNLNLQLFASINKDNSLKELYFFDKEGNIINPPHELLTFFKNQSIKHLTKREESQYGVIPYDKDKFLFFASRGVLWFKENYKTSHGTLVFGRIIDDRFLENYSTTIGYPIKIIPFSNMQHSNQNTKFILPVSFFTNAGYVLVYDFLKKPAFYFYLELPKKQFQSSMIVIAIIILILLLVSFLSYKLLHRKLDETVISKLENFNDQIIKIKNNPDTKKEISITSKNDEIYILQESFNQLFKEIEIKDQLNQKYLQLVEKEKDRFYELLTNVLPKSIAIRMNEIQNSNLENQDKILIADEFEEATILFADIVNFTEWSKNLNPKELVLKLNSLFTQFDFTTEKYNIEKIKTIGDSYMAACGIPESDPYHADNIILFALDMLKILKEFNSNYNVDLSMRIGIHTGKVVAGVIGAKKFIYDVWGDTVNLASRMESSGKGNIIQISELTYNAIRNPELKQFFKFRATLKLKSGHLIKTYILEESEDIRDKINL